MLQIEVPPMIHETQEQAFVAKSVELAKMRPRHASKIQRPAMTESAQLPRYTGDPLPPLHLLNKRKQSGRRFTTEEINRLSRDIERHLASYGIKGKVVNAISGPVITRFELQPMPGVKGSRITKLSRDLARAMSVSNVNVVEQIEGKSVIGLEISNPEREMISMGEILASKSYTNATSVLTMSIGKDDIGRVTTLDLSTLGHLLVESDPNFDERKVHMIDALILSMLFKATAVELRLILIDPRMLELGFYDYIPHLLTPVITDSMDAAHAIRWCVAEMERRYKLMSALGVRNLAGMNKKVLDAAEAGMPLRDPLSVEPDLFATLNSDGPFEPPMLEVLPRIVIVIDKLDDIMAVIGGKVEPLMAKLVQKAHGVGIHLIYCTSESVDLRFDSTLNLYPGPEEGRKDSASLWKWDGDDWKYLETIHPPVIDEHEVKKVVAYLRQAGDPSYIAAVTAGEVEAFEGRGEDEDTENDPLYDQAVAIVIETRKASISWVQRRLKIGYRRAARMVEQMEASRIIGPKGPGGNHEVFAAPHRD